MRIVHISPTTNPGGGTAIRLAVEETYALHVIVPIQKSYAMIGPREKAPFQTLVSVPETWYLRIAPLANVRRAQNTSSGD
jgi:hypothetical protein